MVAEILIDFEKEFLLFTTPLQGKVYTSSFVIIPEIIKREIYRAVF